MLQQPPAVKFVEPEEAQSQPGAGGVGPHACRGVPLPDQACGRIGAPDYTVIQCKIIEKYVSPCALLALQDAGDPVENLKRLTILEALEGPNSRAVQRTLIDLAGSLDGDEQWPRAKAYWDRAVLVTRRLQGGETRAKAAAIRPE